MTIRLHTKPLNSAALAALALCWFAGGIACSREAAAPAATVQEGVAAFAANDGIPEDETLRNDPAAPYVAEKVGDLADKRIDESSGLGASRRYPGYLWTHNDSGDSARAFLVNPAGHTALEVALKGANAIDWEDMAVAGSGGDAWVYLGDIGDNLRLRSLVTVYRFAEAALPAVGEAPGKAEPLDAEAPKVELEPEKMILLYPDGSHDAETLIAAPDGRLVIVAKNDTHSPVYITPEPFIAGGKQLLRRIGDLKLGGVSVWSRLITGGDLSPDGARLVLRTYTHAHEWILEKPWAVDGSWASRKPSSWVLPQTRQGESICYASSGGALFAGSEKTPSPLFRLTPRAGTAEAQPGGGG